MAADIHQAFLVEKKKVVQEGQLEVAQVFPALDIQLPIDIGQDAARDISHVLGKVVIERMRLLFDAIPRGGTRARDEVFDLLHGDLQFLRRAEVFAGHVGEEADGVQVRAEFVVQVGREANPQFRDLPHLEKLQQEDGDSCSRECQQSGPAEDGEVSLLLREACLDRLVDAR